jgi:hypothetical protein
MQIDFDKQPLEITGQMNQLVYLFKQDKITKAEAEIELEKYRQWFAKMTKEMFKSKVITRKARVPSVKELLNTYT